MGLTLTSVGHTYGEQTPYAVDALDGVTMAVEPGELLLVLGETGSGKSTLLRVASGLLAPSVGRATIDGASLTPSSARGAVGLVFQDAESQLFADTVEEDVAFGPRNLGAGPDDAVAAAREALREVGLGDEFLSRSPFTLSGGEARRVALAGVLAMRPRYLLADEPTSGLDAVGRAALRSVLAAALAHSGIVVVSHAAEEFLPLATRVLVLAGGRSAWYGDAQQLIADPTPLTGAGLTPPDVLEVQRLARANGLRVEGFSLDPRVAAERIARAGRWV